MIILYYHDDIIQTQTLMLQPQLYEFEHGLFLTNRFHLKVTQARGRWASGGAWRGGHTPH